MPTTALSDALKQLFQSDRFPKGELFILNVGLPGQEQLHPWHITAFVMNIYSIEDLLLANERYGVTNTTPFCRLELQQLADEAIVDGVRISEETLNQPENWLKHLPNSEPLYSQWKVIEALIEGISPESGTDSITIEIPFGAAPDWSLFCLAPGAGAAIQLPQDSESPARMMICSTALNELSKMTDLPNENPSKFT